MFVSFCRPEGYAVIQETVPDTITSWVATAFAVHPNTGLGLSPGPITVSQIFMLNLLLSAD